MWTKLIGVFVGEKSKKTFMCIVGLVVSIVLFASGIISQEVFLAFVTFFGAGLPASLWAKMDKVAKALVRLEQNSGSAPGK